MYKVFVNGGEGTTGLLIVDRLKERQDVELLKIPEESRKDNKVVRQFINDSDITFLCLPDEAARAAVELAEDNVRIIDASTAHRVKPGWIYGFPELSAGQYGRIRESKRVAVPGCYAGAFIALVHPLVKAGVIPADFPVTATGISGYSGGGKKAIAEYESGGSRDKTLNSPRFYALSQAHKHLPEMQYYSSLTHPPVFVPVIDNFYNGMIVTVPLYAAAFPRRYTRRDVCEIWREHYAEVLSVSGGVVSNVVVKTADEADRIAFLAANELAGGDKIELYVFGNDERMVLAARLDNLGKGACGAALQCMDIQVASFAG